MLLFWSCALVPFAVAATSSFETVDLPNGDGAVRGVVRREFRTFTGIPFAKPPLGALRFMPPERNDAWKPRVLDATDFKPNCAQGFYPGYPDWDGFNLTIEEDCLYLNVYAPTKPSDVDQRFAVGVFIYGGGNYGGGANDDQLHAWRMAGQLKMILVTFNYRLGVFGFLGSKELRAMTKDGSTGNAGFLDQRAALVWVKENIQVFQGASNRVMLFGESSGAADVSTHMAAPGSQGLFQRAMMESGAFTEWTYKTVEKSQANFDYLLNITGCDTATHFPVQCLQSKSWWNLTKLTDKYYADFPYADGWKNSSFAATIDGVTLLAKPPDLVRLGEVSSVPVLLGCNENEGVAFASKFRTSQDYLSMTMTERQYIRWAHRNFPEPWGSEILRRYPVAEFSPFFSASHATGDYVVRCPTHRAMQSLDQPLGMSGEKKRQPIFGYVFNHNPVSKKLHSGSPCEIGSQGAFHGAEIPFFLNVPSFLQTTHEAELASKMSTYLRNFAWSGDPNEAPLYDNSTLPRWPAFTNATQANIVLGTLPDGNITVHAGELKKECQLMDAYFDAGEPSVKPHIAKCFDDGWTWSFEADSCIDDRRPVPNLTKVVVKLPNGDGSVQGLSAGMWQSFRGIPFAEPPLKEKRFLPPVKKRSWSPAVLDATDYKPNCIQIPEIKLDWWGDSPSGLNDTVDEDCLYLNVFKPRQRNLTRLYPVLVVVYAQDNLESGAKDVRFYAEQLAARQKMVVVTFNYRVGIFGFLGSAELREYAPDNSTGNAGLLDQRLVLQWVQQNIEAFQGDRDRVLLMGDSSGASDVSAHMAAPGSHGMFQRAMMMSGAFRVGGQKTMDVAQTNFDFVASKTGCSATGSQVVECLQDIPSEVIVQFFAHKKRGFVGELPFPDGWNNASWTPTVDGVTLSDTASHLARSGRIAQIPVIVGNSRDAGATVGKVSRTSRKFMRMTMPERKYYEWAKENFAQPWADRLLQSYSVNKSKPFWAAVDALSDYVFHCPAYEATESLAQHHPSAPIYFYSFNVQAIGKMWDSGLREDPCAQGQQGVTLASEVAIFLNSREHLGTFYLQDLAEKAATYVRNFAWSGDPNVYPSWVFHREELASWPKFGNDTQRELWFGRASEGNITVRESQARVRCKLWQDYAKAGEPAPLNDITMETITDLIV